MCRDALRIRWIAASLPLLVMTPCEVGRDTVHGFLLQVRPIRSTKIIRTGFPIGFNGYVPGEPRNLHSKHVTKRDLSQMHAPSRKGAHFLSGVPPVKQLQFDMLIEYVPAAEEQLIR